MTTILSSKGQVVLNAALRRSLNLTPGTVFSVRAENRCIILDPVESGRPQAKLGKTSRGGFTVLDAPAEAPPLTSERVRDMLAEFP